MVGKREAEEGTVNLLCISSTGSHEDRLRRSEVGIEKQRLVGQHQIRDIPDGSLSKTYSKSKEWASFTLQWRGIDLRGQLHLSKRHREAQRVHGNGHNVALAG
ncbi:hypothetical protein KM043_016694 [Ampulex compressa]|nr:hypothetical protein KM043_016694 [Ampulex compressa]